MGATMEVKATYLDEETESTIHEIAEENPRVKYFQMPNMIDYLHLSPYAFRLYSHYKRVTGQNGICWESVKTISKYCSMSAGMVTTARKELEAKNLIVIRRKPSRNGSQLFHVTIRDIWDENFKFTIPDEFKDSLSETKDSPHERKDSLSETINTTVNNTSINNINIKSLSAPIAEKQEPVYQEFNNQADMPQEWVDEDKPKRPPKKAKKQPDPRYTHIAYSAYYSITNRRPNREIVDTLIELIGDDPDIEKLRSCYREWLLRGYNVNSAKWVEWYKGGIPGRKANEIKSFRPTNPDDEFYDVVKR